MPRRGTRVVLDGRPPYNWPALIDFLAARATPGVERVWNDGYQRTISVDGRAGAVTVRKAGPEPVLTVDVGISGRNRSDILQRIRRIFDLEVDPVPIAACFSADPLLGPQAAAWPGLRVPGAWDGFELAVRAVLGQQVSVRAATTLAGRLAGAFGAEAMVGNGGLSRLFPTADRLANAPLERLGVMPARAATIRALSRRVAEGRLTLEDRNDPAATVTSLLAVPGIGPWTASYIAMRALGDRDAFPSGDLVLRKAAGGCSARALEARSQAWRPWRAYAVVLLWQAAARSAPSSSGA